MLATLDQNTASNQAQAGQEDGPSKDTHVRETLVRKKKDHITQNTAHHLGTRSEDADDTKIDLQSIVIIQGINLARCTDRILSCIRASIEANISTVAATDIVDGMTTTAIAAAGSAHAAETKVALFRHNAIKEAATVSAKVKAYL